MPNFSFSGNRKEYMMTLGVIDNNFLGRNINFGIAGTFGTNVKYGNLNIGIPRQLLYRNMTLNGGLSYGASQNFRYENGNYYQRGSLPLQKHQPVYREPLPH